MIRKIILLSFLLLAILFLFNSCQKKTERDLIKTIVITKLNPDIIIDEELNISFQTPLDWIAMNTALSEKMVARINKKGEDEFIIYSPKHFYFNDTTNSLLRVGDIKIKNNPFNDSLSIEQYSVLFKKYNREFDIESKNIFNGNINIKQMKLTKNNLISFKYLLINHSKQIIQFDFSIKKENYSELYPLILASVNSIKLL